MSFSIGGIASGLDTNTMIKQLMEIESQPIVRLNQKKDYLKAEQNFFRTLNTKLKSLESLAADLTLKTTFGVSISSSSDEKILKTTSSGSPQHGRYEIEVEKLARAHVVQSNELDKDAASSLNGKLTLYYKDQSFDIEAQGSTNREALESIKNQINSKKTGISASVVETTSGKIRLVLTSKETGEENRIEFGNDKVADSQVTFLDDQGTGLLQGLGIRNDDESLNTLQEYQNAVLKVNNLTVTRSTNTIDDVISGVNINLFDTGKSTVVVEQDTDKIVEKVEEFVKAYNEIITSIRNSIKKDGALQGDTTLRSLESQLFNMVTGSVEDNPAGFRLLSDIGISIDKGVTKGSEMTGTMTIDKDKLKEKLAENVDAFIAFFNSQDPAKSPTDKDYQANPKKQGIATRLKEQLYSWTGFVDGIMTNKVKSYDNQLSFMDDRIDQMNARLDIKEAALRKRFVAMEVAMAKSQAQQMWLNSQLNQLGGWNQGSN